MTSWRKRRSTAILQSSSMIEIQLLPWFMELKALSFCLAPLMKFWILIGSPLIEETSFTYEYTFSRITTLPSLAFLSNCYCKDSCVEFLTARSNGTLCISARLRLSPAILTTKLCSLVPLFVLCPPIVVLFLPKAYTKPLVRPRPVNKIPVFALYK